MRHTFGADRTRRPDGASVGAGGSEPPLVGPGSACGTGRARSVGDQGTRRGGCVAIPRQAAWRARSLRPHSTQTGPVRTQGEHPPAGETLEQAALHGVRRRTGHVDHQRGRALLHRGSGRQRRRDRYRPGVGAPRGERVQARERQQCLPTVASGEQGRWPCRWSCRAPALPRRPRPHRARPRPGTSRRERCRARNTSRCRAGSSAYAASAAARSGCADAVVARETGVRDRPSAGGRIGLGRHGADPATRPG